MPHKRVIQTFPNVSKGCDDQVRLPDLDPSSLGRFGLSPEAARSHLSVVFDDLKAMESSEVWRHDSMQRRGFILAREGQILQRGVDWLIEPLKDRQPRTHLVMSQGAELLVGAAIVQESHRGTPPWVSGYAFLCLHGRAYQLDPFGVNFQAAQGGCNALPKGALPGVLQDAWFSRLAAVRFIRHLPEIAVPHADPLWGSPWWTSFKDAVKRFPRPRARELTDAFAARLGGVKALDKLMCCLNTEVPADFDRPRPYAGYKGDQFFMHRERCDEVLYHVRGSDWSTLNVVPPDNVGPAFDRYFEHVFSRAEGEFDFSPYVTKFLGH